MSAFSSKNFAVLFRTRILGIVGLQIQLIVMSWKAYEMSHDPLILGLIGLAEALPAIGFAFFAGHIVDHGRPYKIYFSSLIALLFNSILILAATSSSFHFSQNLRLSALLLGMCVVGVLKSFIGPSIFSIFPKVVAKADLPSSLAWNSSSYQIASVAGPALGGFLYGTFGSTVGFLAPVVILLIAVLSCACFSAEVKTLENRREREPMLTSFRLAINFIVHQKVLLPTMALDMFAVLFGGAVALLPIFADQILLTGATGLGFLRAASAAGSAGVALYFAKKPLTKISGMQLASAVVVFGIFTIAFALSKSFSLSLILLVFVGIFDGISSIMRATILQVLTPENMRGRISALNSIFITSSNEIGSFESGVAAKILGLVPSVVFGGGMTILISILVKTKCRAFSKMELTLDR